MSLKLKILGLGILAVMATSAFAVMNAGASTGGHFTVGGHHVEILGSEGPNHRVHFLASGGAEGERIGCDEVSYKGTHENDPKTPTTTTSITVAPSWNQCYTTGTPGTKFDVHENGCTLQFTVGKNASTKDNTLHLLCPPNAAVDITHPNCTITVPPQTPTGGVVYTAVTENGTDAITLDATVTLETEYHGGICIFLGTEHTATMTGKATVIGKSGINFVSIKAT